MNRLAQAWKAVVAFLAPGLLLLAERVLLADGNVDGDLLTRALIVGAATSVLVWATRNGASANPTTSTPGPGLASDAGRGTLGTIGAVLLVVALVLLVAKLLLLIAVSCVALVIVAGIGLVLMLVDGSARV